MDFVQDFVSVVICIYSIMLHWIDFDTFFLWSCVVECVKLTLLVHRDTNILYQINLWHILSLILCSRMCQIYFVSSQRRICYIRSTCETFIFLSCTLEHVKCTFSIHSQTRPQKRKTKGESKGLMAKKIKVSSGTKCHPLWPLPFAAAIP